MVCRGRLPRRPDRRELGQYRIHRLGLLDHMIKPGEAYKLGYDAGHDVGYAAGYRAAWDDALAQTIAQLGPDADYIPRTAYIPPPQRSIPEPRQVQPRELPKGDPPEQLVARARWSWRRVERKIRDGPSDTR